MRRNTGSVGVCRFCHENNVGIGTQSPAGPANVPGRLHIVEVDDKLLPRITGFADPAPVPRRMASHSSHQEGDSKEECGEDANAASSSDPR